MSQSNQTNVVVCRACGSKNLFSALDLGDLPIANELLISPSQSDVFPLHLRVCKSCGLGQIQDVVSPERLFRDYRYRSSVSQTFLEHASQYSNMVLDKLDWRDDDWILEIASNDGYLLKNFINKGIKAIGIEPAENIASIARQQGIYTISEFFGSNLARKILKEFGYPRLIVANNVYAHVPNIEDFTAGIDILMDNRTLVSIENPSIMNLLESLQFDSIYHEHFSYLSAFFISHLVEHYGITLIDVERIPTHGGSNRYWLSRISSLRSEQVSQIIQSEIEGGLLDELHWKQFSKDVYAILDEFNLFINEVIDHGGKVAGFGAAAKASTFLNAGKLKFGQIQFIVDESPEKVGRFMPRECVPIVPKQFLKDNQISHLIIFPWNLEAEIAAIVKSIVEYDVELWCAIPYLRKIS